ncbi:MAG: C40 family peptidase [Saprospiraceae bacterium]
MLISKSVFKLYLVLFSLGMLITSCSPSNSSRITGRYSTADKREKSDRKTTSERRYSANERKKESKKYDREAKAIPEGVRSDIVNTALKFQGIAYRSGGKSPDSGFDCSGFTGFVFNQNGFPIKGSSDQQALLGKQKSREDLRPGDLVFFGHDDQISHVAIVSDSSKDHLEVVHATTSVGVKIDLISQSDYWLSRYLFGVDIISK